MFDNQVSRLGPGSNNDAGTNGSTDGIFSDLYVQNRIGKVHEYVQDFDQYIAADYVLTLGGGAVAAIAGDGGLVTLTTAVSAATILQKTPADFQLAKNFRAWNRSLIQVDNVLGQIIAGMLNATATPFTGASQTDGAYFLSSAAGALSFNVAVGGVIASVACGVSLVAAAQAELSWYYDGGVYAAAPNGRVVWQASGPGVTAKARGEIAIPTAGTVSAFPGAVNICPIVGISASTAVARVLTLDLVYSAKDRANINATPAF